MCVCVADRQAGRQAITVRTSFAESIDGELPVTGKREVLLHERMVLPEMVLRQLRL